MPRSTWATAARYCRRIENAYKQADLFVEQPIPEDPAEARLRDLFAEPEA